VTLGLTGCLVTRSALKEKQSEEEIRVQNKALATAQVYEVDEDIRSLRGKVEELENALNQMQSQNRMLEAKRQDSEKAMNDKLIVYQESIERLEAQLLAASQKIETLKSSHVSAPVSAKSSSNNKSTYELAEEYYAKKSWRQAITEYDKYRKNNPKGKYYVDSTFRIGVCFQELGMKDQAKVFYEEVVDSYPNTKTAVLAKERLKKLK
jgi:TolA-binding protein